MPVRRPPGVQLATMGPDVKLPIRQNFDRLATAVDNLQAHGSSAGNSSLRELQRQINVVAKDLQQLRTLVNSINQRLSQL